MSIRNGYDFSTPEDALRNKLGILSYKLLTLRGWFGKGFVALRERFGTREVLIFRKKGGDFEVQALDSVHHLHADDLIYLRSDSKLKLSAHEKPYNPTRRKRNYSLQFLVKVTEYREHILLWGGQELSKEEIRKVVGYREPPRAAAPRPLRVYTAKIPPRKADPRSHKWKE